MLLQTLPLEVITSEIAPRVMYKGTNSEFKNICLLLDLKRVSKFFRTELVPYLFGLLLDKTLGMKDEEKRKTRLLGLLSREPSASQTLCMSEIIFIDAVRKRLCREDGGRRHLCKSQSLGYFPDLLESRLMRLPYDVINRTAGYGVW